MDLPDFLQTFFDDPAYASCWTFAQLSDFACRNLREHQMVILNQLNERCDYPYPDCWILEYGIFTPGLYSYKPVPVYYVSRYVDEFHIYPVFCLDENGKAF